MANKRPHGRHNARVPFAPKHNENETVPHPDTGELSFGLFPGLVNPKFPSGPIFLKRGRHFGPNRGFGLEHIWKEHFKALSEIDVALPVVAQFVAKIICPGAAIHYDFELGARAQRVTVFKSRSGIAIIEQKVDGKNEAFYSVVTAFERLTGAHGSEVGRMPRQARLPPVAVPLAVPEDVSKETV